MEYNITFYIKRVKTLYIYYNQINFMRFIFIDFPLV